MMLNLKLACTVQERALGAIGGSLKSSALCAAAAPKKPTACWASLRRHQASFCSCLAPCVALVSASQVRERCREAAKMIKGMKQLPYETEKTWTPVCRGEGSKRGNVAEVCNIMEVVSKMKAELSFTKSHSTRTLCTW